MSSLQKLLAVLAMVVLIGGVNYAQEKKDASKEESKPTAKETPAERQVYKLEFVIAELEGNKPVNSRSYSLMAQDHDYADMNVSTRVPVNTAPPPATTGVSPLRGDIQYMDVGLSFRFRLIQEGDYVVLNGNFSMSSFAMPDQVKESAGMPPIVRRVSAGVQGAVLPGRRTVIATLDDINSTKRYQVEVTATRVK